MSALEPLVALRPGTLLVTGGDRVVEVSPELAEAFAPGDALFVANGEILHVPQAARLVADRSVNLAHTAFRRMSAVTDAQISNFFEQFAARLADETTWAAIAEVNQADVTEAQRRGRSTTRLQATESLRQNMIAGLRGWLEQPSQRGRVLERVQHEGWHADLVAAELGVVGFVFEGRPNVVADATGVLRGGNTVVFRIGRDALGTAKALLELALTPSLVAAGLPEGAVCLVDSAAHAAAWALFSNPLLSLAVARGSGPAVATLGALAKQAGVAVSLHGTGGAWLFASHSTRAESFEQAVFASLDRKVCNTLNTCCIPETRANELVPVFLSGLRRAAERRGQNAVLHVVDSDTAWVPSELFTKQLAVRRAEGDVKENAAQLLPESELGREWEWEESPEVTLKITRDLGHGIELFNRYSPQFVACLVSEDSAEHEHFFRAVNAPFVGDGFTRWVDGQYALRRPELGLSNWENGRLFGRGGVLSGDSVYTVRTRVRRG